MVNVIPPNHVDDVPVVEPNQHDDVPDVPDPVLVDEDEDPEEEEFEEEEEPQEEEDDMEVEIEEDENEPELTYPYEEVDPLNPPPPASELEPEDVIVFYPKDSDGLLPGLMRRDINSLFGRMASLSRRLCGRKTAHALVEKKGKAKDEYYGKLILDLGNEVRSSVEEGTTVMEKLESVDAAIAAERARHANAGNEARGSGPVRGQDGRKPAVYECARGQKVKLVAAILEGPTLAWWNSKLQPWVWRQMVEPESVKVDAYIWGLSENIKVRDERILEGKNRKWENFQSGDSSGKSNQKDNSHQPSQNNKKQGNVRAIITAPTEKKVSSGSLPVCECCFTRHDVPCMIKCHKCGKVGHKSRNRCLKKVKQEETGEVCGRAYAIKDADPQGPMWLLVANLEILKYWSLETSRRLFNTRNLAQ
ncbi:hypothetical protein Tco_0271925 [Tanacetum coccineum]